MLHEAFPDLSQEAIQDLLNSADGDPMKAAQFLLDSEVGSGVRRKNLIKCLPTELFEDIMQRLSFRELAVFSRTDRENHALIERLLNNVTVLNVPAKASDEAVLGMIARFGELEVVNLSNCKNFGLFSRVPGSLRTRKLAKLNLSNSRKLNDYDLSVLMNGITTLESLDLSNTEITDDGLAAVSLRTNLKKLHFSNCLNFSEIGLNFILTKCLNLTQIELKNTRVSRSFFNLLSRLEQCNIQKMNLSSCRHFDRVNLSMRTLLELQLTLCQNLKNVNLRCEELETLNLSSNAILQSFDLQCPRITHLNLSNCGALRTIQGNLPLLEEINLYNCRNVQIDVLLDFLNFSAESLRVLTLKGMIQLDDQTLFQIADSFAKLEVIDISGCKSITLNAKRILIKRKTFRVIHK